MVTRRTRVRVGGQNGGSNGSWAAASPALTVPAFFSGRPLLEARSARLILKVPPPHLPRLPAPPAMGYGGSLSRSASSVGMMQGLGTSSAKSLGPEGSIDFMGELMLGDNKEQLILLGENSGGQLVDVPGAWRSHRQSRCPSRCQ